jgi:hypothetical protein
MTDSGPTTAGSIVGRLKMDREQWIADMAATRADAKELTALDPTVTVKANVAEAIAELESLKAAQDSASGFVSGPTVGSPTVSPGGAGSADKVAAAQARLTAAENASEAATNRAILAEMRLAEVERTTASDSYRLAAAQEAARVAIERSETAATKAIAAEEALSKAQADAARSALENAAAQDEQAASTDKAGHSMSRIQAIFTAVVALGPGLIPIAGWAVGAGAALTAMVGVGVLAILGIRKELKAGSADANDFALGIGTIKGDLAQLEATAAKGLLGGFQGAIGVIDQKMPQINAETATYSKLLGGIAAVGVGGLLTGWQALQPLISDVNGYLVSVVENLAKFAGSPAFRQFVSYAQASLPKVEQLLNSLVQVAFHLLAAFAPWGALVVDVLQGVVNVLNAMPVQVLSTIAELALGGSLAFKAWTTIPVLLTSVATTLGAVELAENGATVATGALGAAIDFMEGPIGWVIAGLGALIAVIAATSAAQGSGAAATDSYTQAIAADNGVLGENVRLTAAKKLQDSGALDNAKKLGVSTTTLVSASLGNVTAQQAVNKVLDEQSKKMVAHGQVTNDMLEKNKLLQTRIDSVRGSMDAQSGSVKASMDAYNQLQTAMGQSTISTQNQYFAIANLAASYGVSIPVYQQAVGAQKQTADQAAITTETLVQEGDAAALLTNAFTELNKGSLNVAEAQTGVSAANNELVTSFKKNKDVIDGNSAAAVANQQAVQGQVQAAQQYANAVSDQTKSVAAGKKAYADQLASVEGALAKQGLLTASVKAYLDKLYDLKNYNPTMAPIDVKTAAAAKKLHDLQLQLDALSHGIVLRISATGQESFHIVGSKIVGSADGSTITGSGGPRQDNQIRALSVGEEVIRASSARIYRPMLKAINGGSPSEVSRVASSMGIGGSGPSVSGPINVRVVNKSGVAIDDLIELHIQQNNQWQQIHLAAGGHH